MTRKELPLFMLDIYIWMWELDYKEGWVPKNWCFQIVFPKKTLESPLDSKKIKPVNPKGNQSWIFIGRSVTEAPILWSPEQRTDSLERPWCWERLKAGGEGDDRRIRWLDGSTASTDVSLRKLGEMVVGRKWAAVHGVAKSQTWLRDWTTAMLEIAGFQWWSLCMICNHLWMGH